jgi:hypothetical protein
MSKKSTEEPPAESDSRPVTFNRRWYWARAGLVAGLAFLFVLWLAYPARGTVAILWAAGLSAAILGYFVFSYYLLNR